MSAMACPSALPCVVLGGGSRHGRHSSPISYTPIQPHYLRVLTSLVFGHGFPKVTSATFVACRFIAPPQLDKPLHVHATALPPRCSEVQHPIMLHQRCHAPGGEALPWVCFEGISSLSGSRLPNSPSFCSPLFPHVCTSLFRVEPCQTCATA